MRDTANIHIFFYYNNILYDFNSIHLLLSFYFNRKYNGNY